jgi:predicted aspartyl protease
MGVGALRPLLQEGSGLLLPVSFFTFHKSIKTLVAPIKALHTHHPQLFNPTMLPVTKFIGPLISFLFILLVPVCSASGQVKALFDLYQKKDFTGLSHALARQEKPLPRGHKKVFQATILNAYGKAQESNRLLRAVKIDAGNIAAHDTLMYLALKTRYDNQVKLFDYKNAARDGRLLLSVFKPFWSPEDYKEEAEAVRIWRLLSPVPRQQLQKAADTRVQLKRDNGGLLNVPVTVKGQQHELVFDSGAGLSVVSETYAQKLQLKQVSDSTVQIESGITGLATPVKLAVCEKLAIGNIQVAHAVFLVFPDSALSFGGGVYKINGIIGFPIIRDFGTLTFTDQTLLTIPKARVRQQVKPNMIIDGLKPVIYLTWQGQELPYTFDTGGDKTKLSDNFFNRFQPLVEAQGTPVERQAGGTGGSIMLKGYEIAEFTFLCHDKPVTLKNLFISQQPIATNGKVYYGNIGQDLIKQFRTMTISFEDAFILFE